MKEKVTIQINGKEVLIGQTQMMATTSVSRVFKMLQLHSLLPNQAGDVFFFEFKFHNGRNQWVLLPEHGYINLEGPEELIDFYTCETEAQNITFDDFVEKVFRAYYWGKNPPSESFLSRCKRLFGSFFRRTDF